MLNRRGFIRLGPVLVATFASTAVLAAEAVGQVIAMSGKADAQNGTAERSLASGDKVFANEMIRTGPDGRIAMRLGKSTTINLGPSTRLKIERHLVEAGGSFELVEGSMLYEHVRGPASPPSQAQVRSPYGLIAVRGTTFFAGPSRGVFGVFVSHGRVDVTASGRSVPLVPGFGSDIRAPGEAPSPAKAWPIERVREALIATKGRVR